MRGEHGSTVGPAVGSWITRPPRRSDDPAEALVQPSLVGDVHPAVLGPDHVELRGVEWQIERVALEERDPVLEPHQRREHPSRLEVRLRQVDHGDQASELEGQRPRGTAESTAGIEDASPWLETADTGQPPREAEAARVKLVEWLEVVDRERAEVLPRCRQHAEHGRGQVVAFPVLLDRVRILDRHGPPGGHRAGRHFRRRIPGPVRSRS